MFHLKEHQQRGLEKRERFFQGINHPDGDKGPARCLKICPHDDPKFIYGEVYRLRGVCLKRTGVTFKHVPYEIKVG